MSGSQFNAAFEASGMPTSTTVAGDCPICCEEGVQLSNLACGHPGYCIDCHTSELTNLQENNPRPSCPVCAAEISLQVLESLIPAELYERMYNNFYVVWATAGAERLWCADTECAMFIPPSHPSSFRGDRQCFCGKFTCLTCKKLAHDGACAEDQELQDAIDTAKANGGKPCPSCKVVCYRNGGCQHMHLPHHGCLHEWCFLCERDWDDCMGTCPDSHADAERVQQELDEEHEAQLEARFGHRDAEANELFERAGRPLARQVLAGAHVFLIMLREYMARMNEADVEDIFTIMTTALDSVHDIDAPITPRALLVVTEISRQLQNHEFETPNTPPDDAYFENWNVIGALFEINFRSFRSQEFRDYEIEATRMLMAIYGRNGPDDNKLRDEIRERLASFGTI